MQKSTFGECSECSGCSGCSECSALLYLQYMHDVMLDQLFGLLRSAILGARLHLKTF